MIKVIAELGINHGSNVEIAKELINNAADSNCWAIKFQYRNLDGFYSSVSEIGDELIHDQLKNTDLNLNNIRLLTQYAKKRSLKVGISFFTKKDFIEIKNSDINFDFYKIPSAEFSNFNLVNEVIETNKMLILSTGGHTITQIKSNLTQYKFNKNTVLLHCTSNYPTELGNQNLNAIKELKKISNLDVGYSSHDIDYEVNFLAAAFGAKYIERHITLDKSGKSLDDSSSSDFDEFLSITKIINNFKNVLGDKSKPVNQGEVLNLQNLGTSVYSDISLNKGDYINVKKVSIKAPRKGLLFDELKKHIEKPLQKPVEKGEPITQSHFVDSEELDQLYFEFMNKFELSIPVRFHDMESIFKEFKISNYEFHLSYKDIEKIQLTEFEKFSKNNTNLNFTYHLPDYINNFQLFDPLSRDEEIKNKSDRILKKVIQLSKIISEKDIIFVSSLSQNNFKNKEIYYTSLKKFIDNLYHEFGISFLPQWLPKKAWYFGGSYDINLFSSFEDIKLIEENNINICLDVAHLIMSANSAGADWRDWYQILEPFTKHIHLSDSYGTNGEGVEFGEGELGSPVDIIEMKNTVKVLEVWQGHLDNFSGFKKAVTSLKDNYY
tara:strand:+ start:327 stop:2144 length:1818 start_codon:yes stop_codon:yes gene_type:complete